MATAKKTNDIPGWSDKKAEHRAKAEARQAVAPLQDKTFEELKAKDKEDLLKVLAIRFNLIKPS